MKTIKMLLMLSFCAVAEDCEQMNNFVGGVYAEKGFAVVLDKDTAIVNGKLITRDRDLYSTPKGVYINDRGMYSSRNGIVVKDRDLFSSKNGSIVGSGSYYGGTTGTTFVSTCPKVFIRKP